jgi:RimJ/RimL family protein N-acetyltransferase
MQMIKLRPWNEGDAQFIRNLRNDVRLMRWFRQDAPLTLEDQCKFIRTKLKDRTYIGYIIVDRHKAVGFVALTPRKIYLDRAEFSIGIAPEQQGKGYAKEAMRLLHEEAARLGFKYLDSDVFIDNPALSFYLSKCGFKAIKAKEDYHYKAGIGLVDAVYIRKDL